jgi:hypothetical protein
MLALHLAAITHAFAVPLLVEQFTWNDIDGLLSVLLSTMITNGTDGGTRAKYQACADHSAWV